MSDTPRIATCNSCREPIKLVDDVWIHTTCRPRHPAIPMPPSVHSFSSELTDAIKQRDDLQKELTELKIAKSWASYESESFEAKYLKWKKCAEELAESLTEYYENLGPDHKAGLRLAYFRKLKGEK